MELLKIRPAVEVGRRDGHKIDILRHDFWRSMPVVFGPRVAERLRKPSHCFFIAIALDVGARRQENKEKSPPNVFHFFIFERR